MVEEGEFNFAVRLASGGLYGDLDRRHNRPLGGLPATAGKELREALALKGGYDEIDEDKGFCRQERPRGVVDRNRTGVGVPLSDQPHDRATSQMRQRVRK